MVASVKGLPRGARVTTPDGRWRGLLVAEAGTFREDDAVQVRWATGELTIERAADVRRER